jgi:hypothetical protein
MKYIFLSIVLLATAGLPAQTILVPNIPSKEDLATFCSTLSDIRSRIKINFAGFKNGQISSYYNNSTKDLIGNGFKSTFNFPGAIISIIELGENDIYRVYYGTYKTEAKAKAKLESIKKRLTTCLNNFTVQDHPSMINNLEGFLSDIYFIEKKIVNTSKPQVVELFLKRDTGLYSVYMRIGLIDIKSITENENPAINKAPAIMINGQVTTGKIKWLSASNVNYTYTGELLKGKPHGRGFAVSDSGGAIQVFGEFKNGMIDGSTVIRHSNGKIVVANWEQNKPEGTGVLITPDQDIDYGNFINGTMEGGVISVHLDNKIVIQNKRNGKTNGRAIVIEADGLTITDRIFINDIANGPGYQYQAKKKQLFEGIWENGEWVRETTGNYPSFMRNPDFGSSITTDHISIYSDKIVKDNKRLLHDTCFYYDLVNNYRWFGYFDHNKFINGIRLVGDSDRMIGQANDKGDQGFCVWYQKGRNLQTGNYKDGKLDGQGITIDIEDSTIYDGMLSEGTYTGSASMHMKNKEIKIGNFEKGKLVGEGKTIYPDGRSISGFYNITGMLSSVKEVIMPDGKKIDRNPKDISTAINFLLKEWENNFINISFGELSGTRLSGYQRWYSVSGGSSRIIPDREGANGKLHHEFSAEIKKDADYVLIKKEYDDLCKKLSACFITTLAKGKSLKLIPKINKLPGDGKLERIASFFTLPPYPGKKYDPQIRVMVESLYDGYRLTLDIISK